MPHPRTDETLAFIAEHSGNDCRRKVEKDLTDFHIDRDRVEQSLSRIEPAMSMGGFWERVGWPGAERGEQHELVRAVLLTEIANGTVALEHAETLKADLMEHTVPELANQLRGQFPYRAFPGDFEGRAQWSPEHFTDPATHQAGEPYRFLVHGIRADAATIASFDHTEPGSDRTKFDELKKKFPDLTTEQVTDRQTSLKLDSLTQMYTQPHLLKEQIVSASVISDEKHPAWVPAGFILHAPAECVYATAPRDAGLANRTDDIVGHFHDVNRRGQEAGDFLSPQAILDSLRQHEGGYGYNEIVLAGTSPEGGQVTAAGIYVKTDRENRLFVQEGFGQAYVDGPMQARITECALQQNLPIVAIPDGRGSPTITGPAWPFGDAQTLVQDRLRGFEAKVIAIDAGHAIVHKQPPPDGPPLAGPALDRIPLGNSDLKLDDRIQVSAKAGQPIEVARVGVELAPEQRVVPAPPEPVFPSSYHGKVTGVTGDTVTVRKEGAQVRQPPETIHAPGHALAVGDPVHVSGEPGHRAAVSRVPVHSQPLAAHHSH